MTLLLFNYALFNNPTLLAIGWVIAGIEAVTAILQFLKVVFRNNKKIVARLDKSIEKCEKTLTRLRQKQADYQTVIAYENLEKGKTITEPVDVEIPPADGVEEVQTDIDIDAMNKEAQADFDAHERAEFDLTEEPETESEPQAGESYELFKKLVESIKKND